MKTKIKLLVTVLFLAAGVCLTFSLQISRAQQSEKTAEQVYKNIQVFNGQPASNVYDSMNYITGALGVNCAHCHVPNEFEKDDKPAKQAARRMIQMTQTINRGNFGDNPKITCNTCHRGQPEPVALPALFSAPAAIAENPPVSPSKPLPTVEELLDRYISAAGGKAALEKIRTRVMKGEETSLSSAFPSRTRPIEIYTKLPDKIYKIYPSPIENSILAFDGTTGWRANGPRTGRLGSTDLGLIKRETLLLTIQDLRQQFIKLSIAGREMYKNRETIVIEAIPVETRIGSMPILSEKLFFDAESGLLVRRYWEMKTALGVTPAAVDFEDYRDVENTKFPFTIRISLPIIGFTRRFKEVTLNMEIDDTKFILPEPKQ